MGRFGKGQINSSGRRLLEACRKTDFIITNTLYQHKICHRTTWTAPFRNFFTWNGEERKNPIRNQIDYIIVRNRSRRFITDSRSYGGAETDSDHKLVKMNMKIEWTKLEKEGKTAGHIDTNGFADTSKRAKYKELVEAEAIEELLTPQERWQSICKIAKEKAEEVTLMVLIFAGTNFRESKKNALRGYLFLRINTDFSLISFFNGDFDGISEKSTLRGYLISRNQQKFAKLAKISTREN